MTNWYKDHATGKVIKENDQIAISQACCCCDCDNCCESMQTWYNELLFDFSADNCDPITGQLTSSLYSANCQGSNVTVCQADLTCLGDVGNRRARFRLVVLMQSSAPCEFTGTFETEGDCWPPDVTFNFDSGGDCCGNVTIRFYTPNCDLTVCNCRCDNHCTEDNLILTATNYSGCPGIGSSSVNVSCSGGCTWTGSGSFGGVCGSSYDFTVSGADDDNCEGDYTLTIRSGGTTVWTGRDNCTESLCYPTAIVWGPIELPCCSGGSIKITMTEPP